MYGGTTGRHVAPHSRNLRCNKVLHKRVVVLTVATAQIPHVPDE
jgi:K+ transporter